MSAPIASYPLMRSSSHLRRYSYHSILPSSSSSSLSSSTVQPPPSSRPSPKPSSPHTTPTRTLTTHPPPPPTAHYDILIIGGGVVGASLTRLLSERIPSLTVALLDARRPVPVEDVFKSSSSSGKGPSARAYALSPRSLGLLGKGVLGRLEGEGRIASYDSMQIWESDGPATLHFTKDDLHLPLSPPSPSTPPLTQDILGAVIEDAPLVSCLWDELRAAPNVHLLSPVTVSHIQQPSILSPSSSTPIQLTYQPTQSKRQPDDGFDHEPPPPSPSPTTISGSILIAADGAKSPTRTTLGTFPTQTLSYHRTAVTCTVQISESMRGRAYQRFQPNGPIALLPVWNHQQHHHTADGGPYYANIVWSTTPTHAKHLLSLPPTEFVSELESNLRSPPCRTRPILPFSSSSSLPSPLGWVVEEVEALVQNVNVGLSMSAWTERGTVWTAPPRVGGVVGGRVGLELGLMHVERYVGERVCLVGDAAHTIHPMAGQGLNLGISDAECLVRQLQSVVESGMIMTTGGDNTNKYTSNTTGIQYALQQYESERKREVITTMGGIQALHGAFGLEFAPAVYVRSLGMNIVNSVGPVRRYLASVAVGATQIWNGGDGA